MAAQSSCGKLPSHTGTGFRKSRKFIKRATAKLARRNGRKYGEDAPRRTITGWAD